MSKIGDRIKYLRQKDSVPITRLAREVGMPLDEMRAIEHGKKQPPTDLVYRLSEYFQVKPEFFQEEAQAGAADAPSDAELGFSDFDFFKNRKTKGEAKPEPQAKSAGLVSDAAAATVEVETGGLMDMAPEARPLVDVAPAPRIPARPEPPTPPPAPEPTPEPPKATPKPEPEPPQVAERKPKAMPPEPPPAPAPKPPKRPFLPADEAGPAPAAAAPAATGAGHELRIVLDEEAADYTLALVELLITKGYFGRDEWERSLDQVRKRS